MGSRLFREVREARGLAYSVGSAVRGYSDSATLIVYAGCDVAHAQETIDICHREVKKLVQERLTPDFLAEAKRQARGRQLLGLDDSSSQAAGMAYEFAQLGKASSVAEDLADIEAVSPEVIQEIAEELFSNGLPRLESVGPEVSLCLPS
jgi:predicted Zn-dependent peptidase